MTSMNPTNTPTGGSGQVSGHESRPPGEIMRERRLELGWTQKELADRIGVSDAYISALESGSKLPTYANTIVLAEELGLNGDELWEMTRQLHEDLALQKISRKVERLQQAKKLTSDELPRLSPEIAELIESMKEDRHFAAAIRNLSRAIKDPKLRDAVFRSLEAFAKSANP